MKPNFPDLINFEYFASNEEPSLEGSSIISLQTIEHIANTISKRDPLNNRVKSQQFAEMVKTMEQTASVQAKRPVPLDHLHQLYLFAQKAMTHIANNPSRKLIKETAYILPNQLKTPRTKTMNWIANQPGRNIREKIAGKRILAEKTAFVVDTKENKVFYRVMTQLSKEFQNRLAFGVDAGAYDGQETDIERIEEMKRFLSIFKKVKYSEVGDLDISKPVIEPNNRLINDKNYAPIWRLYNELNNRKFNIHKNSEFLYSRFEDIAYIYTALLLSDYEAITAVDLPMSLENQVDRLTAQAYEEKAAFHFNYFYESTGQQQEEELVRVKAVQLGMKQVICEAANGEEIIIPASRFPSMVEFAKLRNVEWLSLNTLQAHTPTAGEPFMARLTLQETPHKKIIVSSLKRNQVIYAVDEQKEISFFIEAREAELLTQRGLPILLRVERDGQQKQFETFADMAGLNEIVGHLCGEIAGIAPFDLTKCEETTKATTEIAKLTMDFTRNIANLYVNNELVPLHHDYLIRYDNATGDEKQLISSNATYLYEFNKQQTSYFDSLDVENEHYQDNISNFTLLMQKLHAHQQINPITPLIYTVPDNIDEFAQVDIKKALNISYKKNFPIWRSVAGAVTMQKDAAKEQLKRLIVIDTQGPQLSATQLKFVEKNNNGLFMHYPSYEVAAELEKKLTLKHLCEAYLALYIEKYKLQLTEQCISNIVTSGLVERCFETKEEQWILPSEQEQPLYLTFDEKLYEIAIARWLDVYERFLRQLKFASKSDTNATALLCLIDFEIDKERLQAIQNSVFPGIPAYRYETAQLLETICDETILQKLLTSEPIWLEYLPDLSLDVIRDGTYDSLQLIKNEYIGNTMGANKLFEIAETLILSAGQTSYLFPLKRGGSLGGKINAVIQHPAFPLKSDLEVNLAIEYKYGYENSYRLILTPIQSHGAIKELEVQWVQEQKVKDAHQVSGHLGVPAGLMSGEEIEAAQNYIDDTLAKVKQLQYTIAADKEVRPNMKFVLKRQLFKGVYMVRKLLRQPLAEVHIYLRDIVASGTYAFLLNMQDEISSKLQKNKSLKNFEDIIVNASRFAHSFGEYIPRTHIDKVIVKFQKNKRYGEHLYASLYRNSDYKPLVQALETEICTTPKKAIRSLRDSIWRDPSILQNLYAQNYKIVECMYGEIKRELKLSAQRKHVQNILYTRDCLEVLLAMLAVRNKPYFEFMQAGLPKALKLAKNIRDVEAVLYEKQNRTTPTLLEFDLEKPAGLWKLSDIGYVLNAYLTGEVKENLISVRTITDEGEES